MVTIVIVEFCAMNADREPARSLIAASIAGGEKAYGEASRGEPPSASAAEMAVLTALEDEARGSAIDAPGWTPDLVNLAPGG